MGFYVWSALLFLTVVRLEGALSRRESPEKYNQTADAKTVYLIRKIEETGVLQGIEALLTTSQDFILQVWTPMHFDQDRISRNTNSQHFGLTHSTEVKVDLMKIREHEESEWSFITWRQDDREEYCPYVVAGDFVAVLSLDGEPPIPYTHRTGPLRTWVHALDDKQLRMRIPIILSFDKNNTDFAVSEPQVQPAPRPPFGQVTTRCDRRTNNPDNRHRGRVDDTTTDATTSVTPSLPLQTAQQESMDIPQDMYVIIGAISAVAVIAVIAALAFCIKSQRKQKSVPSAPRDSLVPVYSGTIHASTQLDPRLSTRNPLYGDDVNFLRSATASIPGSKDGSISYILVPTSGVLPSGETSHYEEVRFLRQSSTVTAKDSTDPRAKDCNKSDKRHTYLDLMADDDSGVLDVSSRSGSTSGSSSSGQDSPVHSPVTREPSGPYWKIDE